MREVVAGKWLKTMENSDKAVILKSSRGRLQEVGISPELPTLRL